MPDLVLIDGNNLLYAMHAHAPLPNIGRETLVKIIERWAARGEAEVILVFDGATPQGPLAKQMASRRITVRFAAPKSADDVLVEMIHRNRDPARVLVVSDDTAIRHEARARRCRYIGSTAFVSELFPPQSTQASQGSAQGVSPPSSGDKPKSVSDEEKQDWLKAFDDGREEDPFEGFDAMKE